MTEAVAGTAPDQSLSNEAKASAIIKRHATYGAITGLIPLPLIDAVVLTGIQVKMIGALADVYKVQFNQQIVKSYVAAIIGGLLPVSPIAGTAIHAVRFIPLFGPLLGITVVPAFAAATTWAVGQVFANHFEHGKTLFDVDINSMKEAVKRNLSRTQPTPATEATAGAL